MTDEPTVYQGSGALQDGLTDNPAKVTKSAISSLASRDLYKLATGHPKQQRVRKYSASIETHTATSIDSGHQKSTDIPHGESVDSRPNDWENDYYNPIMAVNDAPHKTPDDLYDEEYRKKGILVRKFRPLL
ncbi:hypothetical protein F2Q69_00007332 [Brassica cretica]|uniref:Uncharacterized protein n=1 Tax=Brassica cretica TaxID=69181 RepID=A0A8S9PDS0_BRACR|nr:hypothetical protein F2Q69_00007332 [Brassica cretica]